MKNLLKTALLVLDEVLLIVLALVLLWGAGVNLSLPIIIAVIVLTTVFVFIVYRVIVSLAKRRQIGGREGMIGLKGRVVRPLTPEGTIRVHGELWKASCSSGSSIDPNEEVIVAGIKGLNLIVEQLNHKTTKDEV